MVYSVYIYIYIYMCVCTQDARRLGDGKQDDGRYK